MSLYLSKMELSDIYNKYRHKAKLFIFKVPYNYNFKKFIINTKINNYNIRPLIKKTKTCTKVSYYFIALKGTK